MRIWRRNRLEPMPQRFEALALYNAERFRGVAHTAAYDEAMAVLQAEFDVWAGASGSRHQGC